MIQTIAAYVIVAGAALWVIWRMILPATMRAKMRARVTGKDCGDDCGCS